MSERVYRQDQPIPLERDKISGMCNLCGRALSYGDDCHCDEQTPTERPRVDRMDLE